MGILVRQTTDSIRNYDFDERLAWSKQVAGDSLPIVNVVMRSRIPGFKEAIAAGTSDDKRGIDYRIKREGILESLFVDFKARTEDWAAKPPPLAADDLALEVWSVIEKQKIGWTRDPSKRSDYVLWYWQDTHRMVLVPFLPLCRVFIEHWEEWFEKYDHPKQASNGGQWHSQIVLVPRLVVLQKINGWCCETIPAEKIMAERARLGQNGR